ncbi:MAG: helix-turn-helix domain-containing protein [Capsulimonas sp.]|uniref:helix-turn-helix domain-containing protein n=1 Tax=Capsulimonas sp. TaxID=2494211 RepID=UPI0032644B81
MAGRLSVLTPREVAAEFHVSEAVILAELESGRLKGFQLGGGWRTTEDAALELIATLMEEQSDDSPAGVYRPNSINSLVSDEEEAELGEALNLQAPRRRGRPSKASLAGFVKPTIGAVAALPPAVPLPTLEELRELEWEPAQPFLHQWPNAKEKELQDTAFSQIIEIDGKHISLAIGFATRDTASMAARRHATVFWGDIGRTLYPLVQFAGANNFEETGLLASIIRDGSRKTVPADAALPCGYEEMPVGIYNDLISGPYARKSRCVIAHKDDFAVMAKHALLRSQQKGRI